MYTIISRRASRACGSPYAAVKEHQGVVYGFWIRPEKFCSNDVCSLMDTAIEQVFNNEISGIALKYDDIMSRIFREWTHAVVEYHEKEGKPFSADIFKNYGFEMQVLIFPPDEECIVKKYNMKGEFDSKSVTDDDLVTVSLSRYDGFMGNSEAHYSGIICFREKEPFGKKDSQNRYIYSWESLLVSVAKYIADDNALDTDNFDGSFLLAVDTDKLERYLSRHTEKRPYIVIDIHEGRFALYAEKGIFSYADMELISGYRPHKDEYLEITEVTDTHVKFIVDKKYTDGENVKDALLEKGGSVTFRREAEKDWSSYDGSDLLHTDVSKIEISWQA